MALSSRRSALTPSAGHSTTPAAIAIRGPSVGLRARDQLRDAGSPSAPGPPASVCGARIANSSSSSRKRLVDVAQLAAQHAGDRDQHPVAGGAAVGLVDAREPVDVDEREREGVAVAALLGEQDGSQSSSWAGPGRPVTGSDAAPPPRLSTSERVTSPWIEPKTSTSRSTARAKSPGSRSGTSRRTASTSRAWSAARSRGICDGACGPGAQARAAPRRAAAARARARRRSRPRGRRAPRGSWRSAAAPRRRPRAAESSPTSGSGVRSIMRSSHSLASCSRSSRERGIRPGSAASTASHSSGGPVVIAGAVDGAGRRSATRLRTLLRLRELVGHSRDHYTRRAFRRRETRRPGEDVGRSGGPPAGDAIIGATLEGLRRAAEEVEHVAAVAETLQRSLLPERLPELSGLDDRPPATSPAAPTPRSAATGTT